MITWDYDPLILCHYSEPKNVITVIRLDKKTENILYFNYLIIRIHFFFKYIKYIIIFARKSYIQLLTSTYIQLLTSTAAWFPLAASTPAPGPMMSPAGWPGWDGPDLLHKRRKVLVTEDAGSQLSEVSRQFSAFLKIKYHLVYLEH